MNSQALLMAGLTEQESAIYLALLEIGPSSISGISRETGIHRPVIYKIVPRLIEKELVSVAPKGKQKLFIAESPQKLEHLMHEIHAKFQTLLPELEEKHASINKRPLARFLEGRKGISFVFHDLITSLKRGDAFYRYASTDVARVEKYLPPGFREARDKKQLQRYVITNNTASKKSSLDSLVKLVPQQYGLFDYGVNLIIYANKIAFLDFNTETAFIIENATIAEFQKKVFKLLFDKLE